MNAMLSATPKELANMLDLTLPERSGRTDRNPCITDGQVPGLDLGAPLLENLQTSIQRLPYARSEFSKASVLAQAIVAVIAVLALTGCLFFGASRAICCWWVAATLALIWALAIDDDRTRGSSQKKEATGESAVLFVLVLQLVSIAVIWTVFVMDRLK